MKRGEFLSGRLSFSMTFLSFVIWYTSTEVSRRFKSANDDLYICICFVCSLVRRDNVCFMVSFASLNLTTLSFTAQYFFRRIGMSFCSFSRKEMYCNAPLWSSITFQSAGEILVCSIECVLSLWENQYFWPFGLNVQILFWMDFFCCFPGLYLSCARYHLLLLSTFGWRWTGKPFTLKFLSAQIRSECTATEPH